MLLRRCVPVIFVLATLAMPVRAQVQLEWKLREGDVFFLETESKFLQTLELPGKDVGKEIKQDFTQITVLQFKIEKKDEKTGVLTVRETIEGLMVKAGAEAGAAPVIDDKIRDATFTFTLSPPPKVAVDNFQGYKELVDKLSAGDAGLAKTIKAILTEELLKKSAVEAFSFLPAKPVKEGDSWGTDRPIKMPLGPLGVIDATHTYKYEGKGKVGDKEYDKITFTSAIAYTAPKEDGGLPFKVSKGELKSEGGKGTLYFDREAGRLVEYEMSLNMTGQLTLVINNAPVDAKITKQEQTIKVKVSTENPIKKKP